MGVPKFYRWISERYPCLSEVVKEFQLPEFDNLYLDMNGIVHTCSHPEDDNPHFRITEEQIFKDICHYIEFLFRMIKPRKVFFMAIDGVAPRAKMNQQRGRRFRSAREAEELVKRAQEKGEVLPTEKRFDSNCITPGTPFMKRLQDHLKYFVVSKVTYDPLWQGPKIILSGQETPGEGEHKVMDFIRYSRSQPDHDPNTRHCLYGLDADLIMLGLTSHEPHFALLREEVRFAGKKDKGKRSTTPEETTFHLLHLSLMREYLDYEFSPLKSKLSFEYNLENIIDDWILMGFLVGNDFIPHLPHLHIHCDALPLLWKTYMEILPTLDGYLNEGGHLNLKRFEKYIGALAQFDRKQFNDQYLDVKYLEGKKGDMKAADAKKINTMPPKQTKMKDDNAFAALAAYEDMDADHGDPNNGTETGPMRQLQPWEPEDSFYDDDDDDDDDFDTFDAEFSAHKRDYYATKLEYENVTPEVLRSQAYEYVRALQWILLYYYEGVQSWSWFYPHHYAPYISDVRDFSDMRIEFDMSEPFKPFEQLMSVLPAASKEHVPECMQELMTSQSSPVIEYYPVNFKTDLNGKQQEWEAVVLIPFIDENKLLSAIRTKEPFLTAEERQRNSHGPCYLYQYTPEQQGVYPSPMPIAFPDIAASRAKIEAIPKFHFCLPPERIRKGLLAGCLLDVYFPGFPTLKHIPHTHRLDKCQVKVLEQNSRGFNMMLTINELPEQPLEEIAQDLLGQVTWVGWPHLHEAKVFAVANEKYKIEIEELRGKGGNPVVQWKRKELDKGALDDVYKDAGTIKEKYRNRFGVEVGKTTVLLYAGTMTGRKYVYTSQGRITVEKQFSTNHTAFVLQASSKTVLSHATDDMQFRTMDELFPAGAAVFMIGNPHYGCQGEALEVDPKEGRVRVSFLVLEEPDFSAVQLEQQYEEQQYMPGYIAAQRLGISNHLLSRVTGTILIVRGDGGNPHSKANVGLNLKFTKKGLEVPGYTKKTDEGWLYSQKCIDTVNSYMEKFASLWDYIATSSASNSDVYTEVELFPPEETDVTLKDVLKYLEELPCAKVASMKSGADIVGEITVKAIERAVDHAVQMNKKKQKRVKMQVKLHMLFRPLPNQGTLEPDPGTQFEMLDRIVVVKMGYSVPLGLRGTVVGIHPGDTPADTLFDVIFDQDFVGSITIRESNKRGYRVPAVAMLNLSHGMRQHMRHQPQPNKPAAPYNAWQQLPPQHFIRGVNRQGQGHAQGQGGSYSQLLRHEQQIGAYNGAPERYEDRSASYGRMASAQQQPPPQPQFVTPKFTPSSARVPQRGSAPPSLPPAETNDFNQIWQQLMKTNTHGPPLPKMSQGAVHNAANHAPPQPSVAPSVLSKSQSPIVSLSSAAQRLSSVEVPTVNDLIDLGSSEDMLVDLTAPDQHSMSKSTEQDQGQKSRTPSQEKEMGRKPQEKEAGKYTKTRVVTNSNFSQKGGEKAAPDVLGLFEQATKAREARLKAQQPSTSPSQQLQAMEEGDSKAQNPVMTSDKVQALFQQAQKVSNAADNEFSAMFTALQVTHKPALSTDAASPAAEDGSLALKQMLRIGVEESNADKQEASTDPRKSYGKQVSIQELFDVAKQQVTTTAASQPSASAPQPSSTAPPPQPPPPQVSQTLPHPMVPPPSLLGGRPRNPVKDLEAICQMSNQGLPQYNFTLQSKQKGFKATVQIPGGARFEGSLAPSNDEAIESAASVALLCLRQAQQLANMRPQWIQRPMMNIGMVRPGQQFFSSNSAFSPVAAPVLRSGRFGVGTAPMFTQPPPNLLLPGQRVNPPVSLPHHSVPTNFSQPPPVFMSARAQHHPASQQQGPHQPPSFLHALDQRATEAGPHQASDDSTEAERDKKTTRSSTEAFIPMQVTRKQRRKEEAGVSTTSNSSNTVVASPYSEHHRQAPEPRRDSIPTVSDSRPSANGVAVVHKVGGAAAATPSVLKSTGRSRESGDTPKKDSTPTAPGSSGKKRRPRIAANFNMASNCQ